MKKEFNKWLLSKGKPYMEQFKNVPNLIRLDYEKETGLEVPVEIIMYCLDYQLTVYPHYKALLKGFGLSDKAFGMMFGYKYKENWYQSPSREEIIRGAVELLRRYDAFQG